MLRNYFRTVLRDLSKQKMYAAIKIGGFALGIAACMLIAAFIRDELSFDRHYPDGDRIYRMVLDFGGTADVEKGTHFFAPFAEALKREFPEIEQAGRFNPSELFGAGPNQIRRSDGVENAYEPGFIYADQSLLDILRPSFIYGDPAHALNEPNTIVITKSRADKYFPGENPVGKTFVLNSNQEKPYRITGVIADFPATSHLQYQFLLTLKGVEFWQGEQTNWIASNYQTYIKVRPGTDAARLQQKIQTVKDKYMMPAIRQTGNPDFVRIFEKLSFELQPVSDIHLRSQGIDDRSAHGDIRTVWLFGIIGVFILMIACVNFINLSTARSANRAREVGLRKAIGSSRSSLVLRFFAESMLFSFSSFVLGMLLVWALLPYFNMLAAKSLVFPWTAWWLAPVVIAGAVVIGLLAGVYPAFYLSSFKPVEVLKGKIVQGHKSLNMRSALVVFQFAASIALIIGTFIIYRQMNFILNKKLGFDKEQVLLIQGVNTIGDRIQPFKKALLQLPGIQHATASSYLPVEGTKRNDNPFWIEGRTNVDKKITAQMWEVDHDYVKTLGMKIVAGRDFSIAMPTDSQGVIINRSMAHQLGLKDAVGKRITNTNRTWTVIGVVEDFNFESMRKNIRPVCLTIGDVPTILSARVSTADMRGLIGSVNTLWKDFVSGQPLRYTFLNESFGKMYDDVQRTGYIFASFAILAVVIACLGLLGLSSFMVEQRTKEIGIRKVLGASVQNVTLLLSRDFIKLIVIAIIIASPLAWYGMNKWLQNFAYHVDIEWWMFVLAGLLAVTIALLTVGFQSVKAALADPVRSLRSE